MKPMLSPIYDISMLEWLPVGPFEDRRTHLMAPFQFGPCPMALHAVEVLVDRDGMMIAKSKLLEHIVLAIGIIGGNILYQRHTMDGRSYLLFAMPCPSAEVPS